MEDKMSETLDFLLKISFENKKYVIDNLVEYNNYRQIGLSKKTAKQYMEMKYIDGVDLDKVMYEDGTNTTYS